MFRIVLGVVFSIFVISKEAECEDYKIGVITSLTGVAADYGVAIKNGIELALQEKEVDSKNITWIFDDVAFEPRNAVSSFKYLVEVKKVNLVITWGVAFCKALAPMAESSKVPLIGICMDPTVAKDRKYVARFKNTTDEMMKVQVERLKELNQKRIGIVISEHPYLEELLQAFERNLLPEQKIEVLGKLPPSEQDLRSLILKIKNRTDIDVLGVFLFGGQIPSFYKQLQTLKINTPTFGTDFFESLSLITAAQGSMGNIEFAAISVPTIFREKYSEQFGNLSQLSFAYPAFMLSKFLTSPYVDINNNNILESNSFIDQKKISFDEFGHFTLIRGDSVGLYAKFPIAIANTDQLSLKR